jgi:hypothetical protein
MTPLRPAGFQPYDTATCSTGGRLSKGGLKLSAIPGRGGSENELGYLPIDKHGADLLFQIISEQDSAFENQTGADNSPGLPEGTADVAVNTPIATKLG